MTIVAYTLPETLSLLRHETGTITVKVVTPGQTELRYSGSIVDVREKLEALQKAGQARDAKIYVERRPGTSGETPGRS